MKKTFGAKRVARKIGGDEDDDGISAAPLGVTTAASSDLGE